jgi:hypothetical protein
MGAGIVVASRKVVLAPQVGEPAQNRGLVGAVDQSPFLVVSLLSGDPDHPGVL